jgi:hypothetical protein
MSKTLRALSLNDATILSRNFSRERPSRSRKLAFAIQLRFPNWRSKSRILVQRSAAWARGRAALGERPACRTDSRTNLGTLSLYGLSSGRAIVETCRLANMGGA